MLLRNFLSFDLTIIVFFELALDSERLKPDTILRRFAVADNLQFKF